MKQRREGKGPLGKMFPENGKIEKDRNIRFSLLGNLEERRSIGVP